MPHKFKGFTLIELLVTIALVAIIAGISIPAYSKYRVKAKVALLIGAALPAKLAVQNDYFNLGYTFASSDYTANSTPFVTPSSSIVSSIAVTDGVITVTGNSTDFGGRSIVLQFTPTMVNNEITWACHVTNSAYIEFLPLDCQT